MPKVLAKGTSSPDPTVAQDLATKAYVDTGSKYSGTFQFTLANSYQRFTITDANVTTASKIIGSIVRPNINDVDDVGWFYQFNVVKRNNGSFEIAVLVSIFGEDASADLLNAVPGETVQFCYVLG